MDLFSKYKIKTKNKDLYIMVFFVRDGNDLRAFYGEQLHRGSARYMLE